MRVYLGIDTGGIVAIDSQGLVLKKIPFDSCSLVEVARELQLLKPYIKISILSTLEPSHYVKGVNIDMVTAILKSLGIPFKEVEPYQWQGEYEVPKHFTLDERNEFMHRLAEGLYPTHKVTKDEVGAFLIATYAFTKRHVLVSSKFFSDNTRLYQVLTTSGLTIFDCVDDTAYLFLPKDMPRQERDHELHKLGRYIEFTVNVDGFQYSLKRSVNISIVKSILLGSGISFKAVFILFIVFHFNTWKIVFDDNGKVFA